MSSQASFGSSMLFQSINDELNASLATADELSKEFNSLLKEASSEESGTRNPTIQLIPREKPVRLSSSTASTSQSSGSSNGSNSSIQSPKVSISHAPDFVFSNNNTTPSSPAYSSGSVTSRSPLTSTGSDSFSPKLSPHMPRRSPQPHYDASPRGSISYERSPSPSRSAQSRSASLHSGSLHSGSLHPSPNLLSPYDSGSLGRRSPRPVSPSLGRRSPRRDRSPSPLPFASNTLPRNFGFSQPDESVHRQKSPSKWNETDLDVSYERKPHHTYDKSEWVRPTVPNSNWRESNLDGPPPAPSPKKDPRSKSLQYAHSSLPRNTRIAVPPDSPSPGQFPYHSQPIISRISIPPTSTRPRQRRPIPLSVIMRLQNPHWGAMMTRHPRVLEGDEDMMVFPPAMPFPREYFTQPLLMPLQHPPELRQPAIYSDALNPGDIDAELERLDLLHHMPVISESPGMPEGVRDGERPRSPTRLQPVVAPEAQVQQIPNLEELLRIRAEIPRALKRRGSVDQSRPLKQASHYQPNQYKNLINDLFRKKDDPRGEQGSENGSASEGEESAMPPAPLPQTSGLMHELRNIRSILRSSKRERRSGGSRRAHLSPLVLLLDGALVGELETVQRAVQEMNDPSQPNDEGITALHNAICGGHYNVVDFLVRIGANVSAPDSHGWTPLHCAASCNDRPLCEFLVRSGAAVMAMTQSDGATASQKCDPYAVGFEECESFLRGVEEAMGVENSGVLYALWSYPAQAADELSFREGDMVTILQKPEGSDWWWASLCGREGLVPNNYFGLFPKTRPKSLC